MRHEFSTKVKRQARERSGGRCEAVGARYGWPAGERCPSDLAKTGIEYDHWPLGAHAEGSNTIENCSATCPRCNQFAANHTDKKVEAKIKRRQKRIDGTRRQRKQIQSNPKIQSRPFEKRRKPVER